MDRERKHSGGVTVSRLVLSLLSLLAFGLGVVSAQNSSQEDSPRYGGVLNVGIASDPGGIDVANRIIVLAQVIGSHVFETLFTFNTDYDIVPMLAEGFEVSEDGLTYTIPLREGVMFHDGSVMSADDVVASLRRWATTSAQGALVAQDLASLDSIAALDARTVQIRLTQRNGQVPMLLAFRQGMAAIVPARIADASHGQELTGYIGTGPFLFHEHLPDQHIRLLRFEDYVARDEEPSLYAGRKDAFVDEIRFVIVQDASARAAAVEAGNLHFAEQAPPDDLERFRANPDVETRVEGPIGYALFDFNKQAGIMSNPVLRQAFVAALDVDEIMLAQFGDEVFYRLDPAWMWRETPWHSTVGQEFYNQNDPARARQLLEDAGYQGEPVRWLVRPQEGTMAIVARSQLQAAGFNIDLQFLEWPVISQLRNEPDRWDVYNVGATYRPDPLGLPRLQPDFAGWWDDPRVQEGVEVILKEPDFSRQYEAWEGIQALAYEDAIIARLGDYFGLSLLRSSVRGYSGTTEPFFWNVWIAD